MKVGAKGIPTYCISLFMRLKKEGKDLGTYPEDRQWLLAVTVWSAFLSCHVLAALSYRVKCWLCTARREDRNFLA